jgi:tetratricopeptide (TPR) repeat protein
VYDALARKLLNLVGAPQGLALQKLAQTTTGSLEAYRAYLDGSRALNGWQLARADSLFDRATTADTTFALAYYKRALTAGWRNATDPKQLEYIQRAIDHGARLPAQQREILDAYRDLTSALRSASTQDTARTNALYLSAQRKYRDLAARDSSLVEAWYGLGDALWHHQPDGWGNPRTVAAWSASLRAFDRVLALDSTFHLVYSHKLELYRRAAGPTTPFALDGDTLVWLGSAEAQRAYGADRLRAARTAAATRASAEARAWLRTDPVPQAYTALIDLYLETRKFDSALVTVDSALARPNVRSGRLVYLHAALAAQKGGPVGLGEVRAALRDVPASRLRDEGIYGEIIDYTLQAGQSAAFGGGVKEVDQLGAVMAELFPQIPGTHLTGTLLARWWALHARLAMGVPWAELRAPFDSAVQAVERGTPGQEARSRGALASALYVAYLASRDPKYMKRLRSWGPDYPPMPEIDALEAITGGDTARARTIARGFPPPDSIRAVGGSLTPMRWIARAQVLEELGDARRAVANYEILEPTRFSPMGRIDVMLPLYARSFLARGRLYEQLGEREKAVKAYTTFLEHWRDADPVLEPQRQEARAGLARLGDAAGTPVPTKR